MFKGGSREHLCLIKTALTLFCTKERDGNNENRFHPVRVKAVEAVCQQPTQRLCSRVDLLVLQEMNQSAQRAVIAAISVSAYKSWGHAAAHPAKYRFLVVLENVYRLAANLAADDVKTLNGINAGGANRKS